MRRDVFTIALLLGPAALARAQSGAEGAEFPEAGQLRIAVDVRVLNGYESGHGYFSTRIERGIGENRSLVIRTTGSDRKTIAGAGFALHHGGADYEAALRFRPNAGAPWIASAGIARPDTAARRNSLQATGQLLYRKGALSLNPRGVVGSGGALAGLGVGYERASGAKQTLFVEATPILAGKNDRALSTGLARRTTLWGVGVRFEKPGAKHSVTLGITNALGATTGMSLTPQLKGAAISIRFEVTR